MLHPEGCVSSIIDGADMSAFGLPHFITFSKGQRGHALKVKLIGPLEHKHERKFRLLTISEKLK